MTENEYRWEIARLLALFVASVSSLAMFMYYVTTDATEMAALCGMMAIVCGWIIPNRK